MTSSPPVEAPHYRGKTLTPESPVPVHVPEPENIPVLINQTDLTFNDMSTHMEQRYPAQSEIQTETSGYPPGLHNLHSQTQESNGFTISQPLGDSLGGVDNKNENQASLENALTYNEGAIRTNQGSDIPENLVHSQPSVPNGNDESLSTHANSTSTSLNPTQSFDAPETAAQAIAVSPQDPQTKPLSQGPDANVLPPLGESDAHSNASSSDINGDGVNYQALLDNLSPSTSTAPASENITSITTAAPPAPSSPSSAQTPIATLPIPAGLPARPPPQEKPAIHPNYTPGEDIRSYHNPPAQNSNTAAAFNPQSNNPPRPPQGYNASSGVAPNGLPPPPLATFQQPLPNTNQSQTSTKEGGSGQQDIPGQNEVRPPASNDSDNEVTRRPEVEKLYEEFLREEAIYVAEGTWDRFPQGSRLFIGNLFTEKATKRDIFYVFHKYGRLAQISMKSAYGFVQYHDSNACMSALHSEQGIELRGRKIHLEVSKPQKNARNATATAAGDSLRAGYRRRSRSPDYTRGGTGYQVGPRPGADRYDRNSGSIPFERRGRDDYRPGMRSPSPLGYRGRDDYRPGSRRSPDRYYRGRSRSPYDRNGQYRNRSPRRPDPDDEANLPILRRNPRDVPDVQVILVDEVDRTFVGYIQQSFRGRGLRCDVLQLPRVSLSAVVKRQVVEGVQAVVKIFRRSQLTGKIPLQVYNRSAGIDNVRFDDYEDLDANIAAEIVIRAKTTHLAPAPPPQQYQQPQPYGASPYQQPLPHQQIQNTQPQAQAQAPSNPPNLANLITSLDGPALQKLLGAMSQQQTPQTPSNPHQSPHPQQQQPAQQQDLSSLLQSVSRQQPMMQQNQQQPQQPQQPQQAYQAPPQQGYQYGGGPPQQQQQQNAYGAPHPNHQYGGNPAFSPQNANFAGRPPPQGYPPQQQQQQHQPPQQNNVQDMLAQLARYKQ
ncbi:nuclear polyadenylated RNA-binding protein 3 [Lecanora helva]